MHSKTCHSCSPDGHIIGSLLLAAPPDCTQTSALRNMVARTRRALRAGTLRIVVNLSAVTMMDSCLVATVLMVLREAMRYGARMQITGMSEQFMTWASTLHVLPILRSCTESIDSRCAQCSA